MTYLPLIFSLSKAYTYYTYLRTSFRNTLTNRVVRIERFETLETLLEGILYYKKIEKTRGKKLEKTNNRCAADVMKTSTNK